MNTVSKLSVLFFAASLLFAVQPLQSQESPQNLALGKKYTLSPKPTYKHCTDSDDVIQLTDGQTTTGYFWTQKGTVGWQHVPFAAITVDLEKVEPISGVELTTAAGVAGVTWPIAVYIQTSEDGKVFRNAGELVSLDLKANGPLPENYAIRCLSTKELQTRGRFVRFFLLSSGTFLFTDEIRVFRGDDSLLQGEPRGEIVAADPGQLFKQEKMSMSLNRRFTADVAGLKKLLAETKIDEAVKQQLAARIAAVEKEVAAAVADKKFPFDGSAMTPDFKTIFPIGPQHAETFKIQAAIWNAAGVKFHATPACPWDKANLFEIPDSKDFDTKKRIEVHAMQGEYRSAAFNLYNPTQEPQHIQIIVDGIPFSEYSVFDVPWTDTTQLEPVLAATKIPGTKNNTTVSISVQPGLTKQIFLTFKPNQLSPKNYDAKISLHITGQNPRPLGEIPLSLTVWPVKFPEKTSLLVGGWSYTNGKGAYSVNPKNRDSFLKHLKEHFVNAPWARPSVIFSFDYDAKTNAVNLDTKEMDDWIAQWSDAREYCIFLSVPPSIKGIKHDAPEFETAVAAWISAWVGHWKSKGIEPERINLLVSDEPGLSFDLTPTFAWGRAIRKAQPKVKLWVDPVYTDLSKAPNEIFELNDVICPNRPQWLNNRNGFDKFYFDWQKKGKTLQLYSCSGPVKLLDPYSYFRLQAWECARIGGTGSFFWAFGDGGGVSAWNEYLAPRNMYTPIFIDPNDATVVGGKHMEAMREGIEDFETMRMLQTLIDRCKAEGKPVGDAETVLKDSVDAVFRAENVDKIFWKDAKDRSVADRSRVRILEAIRKLGE